VKEIVAVDQNWGIGCDGKLLRRISGDMARFREMTLHKVVVMGRATFLSLPKQEPLKDRVNIVISRNPGFTKEGVTVCRSLDELSGELKQYNTDDVFIIGGGSVYALLLSYCTESYVTKIDNTYPADTYYPNLDEVNGWKLISESEPMVDKDIEFHYTVYKNESPERYA
jgi:dihydrofolate reductase